MKNKTRKDKRQQKTGAKAVCNSCQNNGTCDYCRSNRVIKNKKRLMLTIQRLKE